MTLAALISFTESRMSHGDRAFARLQLVVEPPAIGAGFQDRTTESVSLKWVGAQAAKRSRAKATWGEHDVLLAIYRSYYEIAAMHIQGHIPAYLR